MNQIFQSVNLSPCPEWTRRLLFDDIKEISHQLSKIGNNLNQLIVLAHQGKINEVGLKKTREAFTGLL